jgi:hypothetical protein
MQFQTGVSRNFQTYSVSSNMSTGTFFTFKLYRENRFLGFLYRGLDHILIAMPMNILFLYILFRFLRAQKWNLLTFGIFGLGESNAQAVRPKASIYDNPALIPFAWNFIINMLLIILFANIDVIDIL